MLEVSHGYHAVGAVDITVAELGRLEGEHREVTLRVRALVQADRHARYTCGGEGELTTTQLRILTGVVQIKNNNTSRGTRVGYVSLPGHRSFPVLV